jgi:hypothetical protein
MMARCRQSKGWSYLLLECTDLVNVSSDVGYEESRKERNESIIEEQFQF